MGGRLLRAAVGAAALVLAPFLAAAEPVTIFAAASTADAVEAIGESFTDRTGTEVVPVFAASSTLARQIAAGAPADVYLSANERWMDHLAEQGRLEPGTRMELLANRLALIAPAGSSMKPGDIRELDLVALLGDRRLAVGDPAHVPAGMYAQQALEHLGLWDEVRPRLASGASVRHALAFVARGEAPLGIVYSSDAETFDSVETVALFPEDSHAPIVYPAAILAGHARPEVVAFFDFMRSPEAAALFRRYGFTVR